MHATTLLLPFLGACLAALMLSAPDDVQAGQPLVTDDARFVDAGACQLEIWAKRSRDSTDLWSAPACNVTGNLELSLGAARTHDRDRTYSTNVQAQGKTLIKPLQTNGWGLGVVAGTVNHPHLRARDWYAYAPISTSFLDDRIVVHTNLGIVREGDSGERRATWALAVETKLGESAFLIAEVFGQDKGRASHQLGVRYWIVPNHVQLDATYGNTAGDRLADRWFSVGLRLLSPAFFGSFGR